MAGDPPGHFGLAQFLRQARQLAGMTQEELADRSGLSVRTLGDLERGLTRQPRRSSVQLLLTALGLSEPELAGLARSFGPGLPDNVRSLLPGAWAAAEPPTRRRYAWAGPGGEVPDTDGPSPLAEGWQEAGVPGRSPSHRRPRPAQLPADIPDFTGRAEALAELRGSLSRRQCPGDVPSVAVSVVVGSGGLGKTTLAVRASHLVAEEFPDGQLYVNLLGATQPRDPSDVLGRFLRDLGMDAARIPADPDERSAALRTLLAGRRVLILLDDARDASQVQPLLPGSASCAVLVTSRSRMPDLPGARLLDLDLLPSEEAHALFARVVGEKRATAEPEATTAVLAACAGLPLAIRIAGARLASRSAWNVATLGSRLADERRRLDELRAGNLAVRASFEVSFTSLASAGGPDGGDPRRAFRLLGAWTGPAISLPAAAALLGERELDAADALGALVDAHLLDEPQPDQYRFHDLLRMYAADRALAQESGTGRRDAITRVLTWYVHTTEATGRIISPQHRRVPLGPPPPGVVPLEFATLADALAWCETERLNLTAATLLAAEWSLHELAWQLAAAAMSFFERRGYWTDWVSTHQTGLASARAVGCQQAEGWMLNNLCMVYGVERREEALGCAEQAQAIYSALGDELGAARIAANTAHAYWLLRRYPEALAAAQDSVARSRTVGNRYGEGIALCILGCAFRELGKPGEAVSQLREALQIFRDLSELMCEADTLSDLGETYLAMGSVAEATECLGVALTSLREVGDRHRQARTLQQLAHAHRLDGTPGQARELLTQALRMYEDIGDQAGAALARADLESLLSPRGQMSSQEH